MNIAVPWRLGIPVIFAQRLALVVEIGFFPVERRDGTDFGVADAKLVGVVEDGMDVNG